MHQPGTDDRLQAARQQARTEALHRALLAGLLGNIGQKTDTHEYAGVHGRKFSLFPGSSLFQKKPSWVASAEMVETTRLYARTNAPIKPEWVEKLASHLVKRTHTDARWSRNAGEVLANERVALHGLLLIPKRSVQYAPFDARAARELFIHHALVLGDWTLDAPFVRNNFNLIRELELTEAKLRRRNVLVDLKTRFAFYEARLPAGVVGGATFEAWRRQAESKNRRVLFMSREDLTLPDSSAAAAEQYPDEVVINGIKLPLEYRYDPGHDEDGITAALPLAALNQLPGEPFEWVVPGWIREKVVGLIKSLPKQLRVSFVPAPEFADQAVAAMRFGQGSLRHALAWQLGRTSGLQIPKDAWHPEELDRHLHVQFRIVDEAGKTVMSGRDLGEIRSRLHVELKNTFESLPAGPWNRGGLTKWDFGDLPGQVEVEQHGFTLIGYPGIVDDGLTVALRLFETPEAAHHASRGGVRRLFIIEYSPTIQYELRDLPQLQQMALHYAPLGSGKELKDDLVTVSADRVFFGDALNVRTQMEFELRLESSWNRLRPVAIEVAQTVAKVLETHHNLTLQLGQTYPPMLLPAIAEMRQHLAGLMPKDFLKRTPEAWLQHLPRFVKGIEIRLNKLRNAGFSRDLAASQLIQPLWKNYVERRAKHHKEGTADAELGTYRWMLEELRVSLFAQELKASIPISVQRVEKQWQRVKP